MINSVWLEGGVEMTSFFSSKSSGSGDFRQLFGF